MNFSSQNVFKQKLNNSLSVIKGHRGQLWDPEQVIPHFLIQSQIIIEHVQCGRPCRHNGTRNRWGSCPGGAYNLQSLICKRDYVRHTIWVWLKEKLYVEIDNYKTIYECIILKSISRITNICAGKGGKDLKAKFISKGILFTHATCILPNRLLI